MTKNAANTLDTFTDTMKAAAKWGDNPLKLVDGITAETGSKAMKALETGGDFAKESKKAVWEMKAVSGADGIRLKTSVDESVSFFKQGFAGTDGVAKSARKSGKKILNVGAGDNPIPCATNIDINPGASGVLFGDVNDLSQFASGQFDHVIALNPYKYNLLDSDVPRVLKDGGIMSVTGNYSNRYFKNIYKASPETLRQAGFEIVSKGNAGSAFIKYGGKVTYGVRQTKGTPLQIILRKVGGQ